MTMTFSAVPVDGTGVVNLDLSFGGSFDTFQIIRTNLDTGSQVAVRGASYRDTPGGGLDFIGFDLECPLSPYGGISPSVQYEAFAYTVNPDGSIATTTSVLGLNDDGLSQLQLFDDDRVCWVKNPAIGNVDKKFLLGADSFADVVHPVRILANTTVLDRPNPVITSDVLGGITGTFYISSYQEAEDVFGYAFSRSEIMALFAPGSTLFFQTTESTTDIDDFYFIVTGDITESLLGGPIDKDRMWTIPFTQVDSPEADLTLTPSVTWLDVATNHISWQDILDTTPTWLVLLEQG